MPCGFELQSAGECDTLLTESSFGGLLLGGKDMPAIETIWVQVITMLCLLAGILLCVRHFMRWHMVRIYNWDGKRYRFLGREYLRKINDTYVINMRERLGDMSYTTRYRVSASPAFVKRHRYGSLLLRAGRSEAWLPIEERMLQDIYYRNVRIQ